MFWEVIRFPPGRGGPGVEIPVLFPDLRMIGDDIFMTKKTLLHRRNPRMIGPPSIGMTERTLYLLYRNVDAVTEGYGLFRTNLGRWRNVEIVEEEQNEKEATHS